MNGARSWSVLKKGVFSFRLLQPSYTLFIVPIWAWSDDGGVFSVEGLKFYVDDSSLQKFFGSPLVVAWIGGACQRSFLFNDVLPVFPCVLLRCCLPLLQRELLGVKEWDPAASLNWQAQKKYVHVLWVVIASLKKEIWIVRFGNIHIQSFYAGWQIALMSFVWHGTC